MSEIETNKNIQTKPQICDLITQPWLDGLALGATIQRTYSLKESVLQAHTILELTGDTPFETASILRFQIAFVGRVYNLTDKATWRSIWNQGTFPSQPLDEYLARWHDRFDLVSETHPFYQCAGLSTDKPDTLHRLSAESASGNNPTLFDHRIDARPYSFAPAKAARMVMAAQLYSPAGGKVKEAIVQGYRFKRPNLTDAAAFVGATYWMTGDNWFETLMLNANPSLETSEKDRPCWENDANPSLETSEKDRPCWENDLRRQFLNASAEAPAGIFERLTWQSRLLRLDPKIDGAGNLTFSKVYYTHGRTISEQTGDPMKADRRTKKDGMYPVTVSRQKAGWRDVHSVLRRTNNSDEKGRPPNVVNYAASFQQHMPIAREFGLEAIGADADQAKLVVWRHDRFSIPRALLSNADLNTRLEDATRLAEEEAGHLRISVRAVCGFYISLDQENRKPDSKDVDHVYQLIDPLPQYWSRLENGFTKLLGELGNPETADDAFGNWREFVEKESRTAKLTALDALGQSKRAQMARGKAVAYPITTAKGKRKKEAKNAR